MHIAYDYYEPLSINVSDKTYFVTDIYD